MYLKYSKTSQKHFTNESFNDNSSEYLQSIHLEIKTLLKLESLFSHHKYELINNTNFNLINYSGNVKILIQMIHIQPKIKILWIL